MNAISNKRAERLTSVLARSRLMWQHQKKHRESGATEHQALQIRHGETPDILLLGNGINRAYGFVSREELVRIIRVKEMTEQEESPVTSVPHPLHPMIPMGDPLSARMKEISHWLSELEVPEEENSTLQDLASVPFDAILTANYTYEMEKALDPSFVCLPARQCKARMTACDVRGKYDIQQLHTYFQIAGAPSIWHIHGEAARHGTMILGRYYYEKLLSRLQRYVPSLIARYSASAAHGQDMAVRSWIDLFMLGNVHVAGLGLSLSEMDLWWLINCKKRHFPDTKVTLYKPDLRAEERALAEAYGVDVVTDGFGGDFREYYRDVSRKLKSAVGEASV